MTPLFSVFSIVLLAPVAPTQASPTASAAEVAPPSSPAPVALPPSAEPVAVGAPADSPAPTPSAPASAAPPTAIPSPTDPRAPSPSTPTSVSADPSSDLQQPVHTGRARAGVPDPGMAEVPGNAVPQDTGKLLDLERSGFKPGKGLVLSSRNDRFALALRLRGMFLYDFVHDATPADGDNALSHAFQVRRARVQFTGHAFNEHNKFKIQLALSPRDIDLTDTGSRRTPIFDWYSEFDYLRDLSFRVGQYVIPFSRQRLISSGDLELVDRSLAQHEFQLDRDVGFHFFSLDFLGVDRLRYYAGVFLGEGRDPFQETDFHLMYLGRAEVLPLGGATGKADYQEADLERCKKPMLSLGAAYAYIDEGRRNLGILGKNPSDGGTTDFHNVTADLMFKIHGVTLSGAFHWRHGTRHYGDATMLDDMGDEVPAPRELPRNGLGWYAQAGYVVPKIPFQVAGRYSQIRALGDDESTSLADRDELGGGLSWYFYEHPVKVQADYFRQWDEAIAEGVDHVRIQFQLGF